MFVHDDAIIHQQAGGFCQLGIGDETDADDDEVGWHGRLVTTLDGGDKLASRIRDEAGHGDAGADFDTFAFMNPLIER